MAQVVADLEGEAMTPQDIKCVGDAHTGSPRLLEGEQKVPAFPTQHQLGLGGFQADLGEKVRVSLSVNPSADTQGRHL